METTMIGAYVGMLMGLIAFAAETRGIISSRSFNYLVLMAIGELLLTLRAYVTVEWPFAVLVGGLGCLCNIFYTTASKKYFELNTRCLNYTN